MSSPSVIVFRHRTRGVALVIVLAFVVLLSGLVLAFFSRALSERQISNSSANAVRVDLFAQGAVATTLGDLRQEIAAGSAQPFPNPTPGVYLYNPKTPAAAAPSQAGVTGNALPNLLKRSANNTPFFTGASYDTTNYPPSKRAANSSSITLSQNGRTISPARWNKALLLPKKDLSAANDTDFTPVGATGTAWAMAPDWVVVARDGSNPSTWADALKTNGTNPAIGRYAYNLYNEGGLLDMNAAGYPDVTGVGLAPQGKDPIYKSSLAFADLKQLPGISDLPGGPTGRQEQIVRTLVGWRNYAAAATDLTQTTPTAGTPISGSVNVSPGYAWSSDGAPGSNVLNYLNFLRYTNPGFLSPANRLVVNRQSDRSFASRQQLMNLMLNSIADQTSSGTAERAALQNSLQYLSTFSRSLNQPSYFPVSRVLDTQNNPNPRPTILPSYNTTDPSKGGGNNVGDLENYPLPADQDKLSPSFLTLRAEAAFTRNDGATTATVGEPLVKTRFALQRLAWLTCQGPSALRSIPTSDPGGNSTDEDMWLLVNNYGISRTYLLQGTEDNIKHYFGLEWDKTNHCWKYDLHNRNGAAAGNVTGATGAIRQLKEIADLKTREPDFFELLKASVDPGALAKASTNSPTADTAPGGGVAPLNVQFYRDISLDAAVIQLGANIIDQFDADGFPTRIVFNDGVKPVREFRGIENLPYVYRVRTGILRAREPVAENNVPGNAGGRYSNPNGCTPELHSGISPGYAQNALQDAGVGVLMALPDIWNPHDQNSSLGLPRPGAKLDSLRVIAVSSAPDYLTSTDAYNTVSLASPNAIAVGGFVNSTKLMGRYQGANYQPTGNGGGGAVSPGTVGTGADRPIPIFSRTPTPTGTGGIAMTGNNFGYNNQQVISSLPFAMSGGPANPANSSTLYFSIPSTALFREPTLLARPDTTSGGSGLRMSISNPDITGLQDKDGNPVLLSSGGLKSLIANPLSLPAAVDNNQPYIGVYLGVFPLRWVGVRWSLAPQAPPIPPSKTPPPSYWVYTVSTPAVQAGPAIGVTYCLQCQDAYGQWVTYDEKYVDPNVIWQWVPNGLLQDPAAAVSTYVDPRTSRFGAPEENNIDTDPKGHDGGHFRDPVTAGNWLDVNTGVIVTERPDVKPGFGTNFRSKYNPTGNTDWAYVTAPGWHYKGIGNVTTGNGAGTCFFQSGLFAQNDPAFVDDGYRFAGDTTGAGPLDAEFYSDPDGVVRRGMGAYVASNTGTVGQPLATASSYPSGKASASAQSASRPKLLNRPFRSVAELGYVFSGTPWKNLDFSTPESGYSELLDVFCVNETDDASGLVAGKLDLNTRQAPVLTAMLTGTCTNETTAAPTLLTASDALGIANLLVKRTTTGPGTSTGDPRPLANLGDLVGKWTSKQTINGGSYYPPLNTNHNTDGQASYDGFSKDIGLSSTTTLAAANPLVAPIEAQRETAVRALASVGNTRVWNLMIDVIAQTGRYPSGAGTLNNFIVEGEQRCWMHVAIDRCTGQVIDSKLEIVKE